MYISTHFTYDEVIRSSTAARLEIDNSLPKSLLPAILNSAAHMELVRLCLKNSRIQITSWYRCLELNRLLKSKDTSAHVRGNAIDFISPTFGSPLQVVRELSHNFSVLQFDQLILEHTWVHISFVSDPTVKPRGQVLTLLSNGTYAVGITDKNGNEVV